jgi:hypothetical protein
METEEEAAEAEAEAEAEKGHCRTLPVYQLACL